MKILAVTDHFINQSVIEKELAVFLPEEEKTEISCISSKWPLTPTEDGEEVKEFCGSEDDIRKAAEDADIMVNHVGPVTEHVLASAKQLKLIVVTRGGPVNINIEAATKYGIPVVNTPGRNGPVVAEYTVGMILAGIHNIAQAHADMRNRTWRGDFYVYENSGFELNGSTAGLVGFGAIGSKVAVILKSFGMNVLVYDPYIDGESLKKQQLQPASLHELLAQSDIVSLHARYSSETRHMISRPQLEAMKPGAFFVNTARGGLVNYADLTDALQSGQLSGAALDVFDEEPLPEHSPLYALPNVVLTPHIGGSSRETAQRAVRIAGEEIRRFLAGEPLRYCLNPQVLDSRS